MAAFLALILRLLIGERAGANLVRRGLLQNPARGLAVDGYRLGSPWTDGNGDIDEAMAEYFDKPFWIGFAPSGVKYEPNGSLEARCRRSDRARRPVPRGNRGIGCRRRAPKSHWEPDLGTGVRPVISAD